jgi:DNA-binding NarL/FixJ family response regulator
VRRTVLIVDDHPEFRASVRKLLEAEGYTVVGEAADSTQAFAAVAELKPAVVLLDITLPGPDGLAVAEQLTAGDDSPAVVLISSRDAIEYGPRLARTRARGFIAKDELSGERLAALLG